MHFSTIRRKFSRSRRPQIPSQFIENIDLYHNHKPNPSPPFTTSLPPSLSQLPGSVILNIIRLLDPPTTILLSFTNRRFHSLIKPALVNLTPCEKWLVMTYLEENWLSGLEPALPTDAFQHPAPWLMSSEMKHEAWKRAESGMMVTCVLCKTKQLAMAFEALDLLNPPTSRLCKQHRKQLVHPNLVLPWDHQRDGETRSWRVTAGPPRRYPLVTPSAAAFQRRWISTMRAMCTHCGKVHDWEPCDCEDVCSTCPTLQVRVYERYKHMQDTQVFEWDFQKERHGTLLVREETFGKTSIFTSERFKSWGSAASRISELYG